MEASGIFKFWRNASVGTDVSSEVDDVRNADFDDETDDDDSLFDLNITSPDGGAVYGGCESLKKDYQFIESPRDVFLSKNDFSNSKPSSPITPLRSTPKFKVFLLGLKKSSKNCKTEPSSELKASPLSQFSRPSKIGLSNRFEVKCRAGETPVAPVFTRDNSLRSKLLKETSDYENVSDVVSSGKSVPKYLKLMKPFYAKGSKTAKVTESVTPSSSPMTVNVSPMKFSEGSRMNSFKMVSKNFAKSRSASAAVGAAPPPFLCRRDDSLLDDGIQGAILHCKKSFNAVSSLEFPQLSRSASDPSYEKMKPLVRSSYAEQTRCSI